LNFKYVFPLIIIIQIISTLIFCIFSIFSSKIDKLLVIIREILILFCCVYLYIIVFTSKEEKDKLFELKLFVGVFTFMISLFLFVTSLKLVY